MSSDGSGFTTDLTREYRARRDQLAVSFPEGHRFLVELEALCAREPRFHLGTTKNLHLYVEDRFLCYVKIDQPTALVFSSAPNVSIKAGTREDAGTFVPKPLERLTMEHHGFRERWAVRVDAERLKILPAAPRSFFDAVLTLVASLG